MTIRRTGATLLAVLLAALAAGCGGDDESSAGQWAGDVCSALSDWQTSVQGAVDSVQASPSASSVQSAVDDAGQATDDLLSTLRGLGAPETDAGRQADEAVKQLADDVQQATSTIEDAASDQSGLLQAASTITAALATLQSQISSTVQELQGLDGGDELRKAFEQADSCDELRGQRR